MFSSFLSISLNYANILDANLGSLVAQNSQTSSCFITSVLLNIFMYLTKSNENMFHINIDVDTLKLNKWIKGKNSRNFVSHKICVKEWQDCLTSVTSTILILEKKLNECEWVEFLAYYVWWGLRQMDGEMGVNGQIIYEEKSLDRWAGSI